MTGAKTPSFNLVDEPWVRVRTLAGDAVELSLLDVFRHASSLDRLANDLPTQNFAILRILLAILQRSLVGWQDEFEYPSEAWGELWRSDELPLEEIEAYLHAWRHRFNLFDDEQPFMQVAGMVSQNGKTKDIRVLMGISENKPQLFPVKTLRGMESLSFAEAARWLIHAHAFDVAGIKTGVVGDRAAKAGKSSPRGTGWAGELGGYYLEGSTLAETLLLNLVLCDDCYDDLDEWFSVDDLPVWEQDQKTPGDDERTPTGRADVFTWQSRRVRLIAEGDRVVGAVLTNGDKLDPNNQTHVETMTAWYRSQTQEKKLRLPVVYRPSLLRSDRAIWRGLTTILPQMNSEEDRCKAPGVVMWTGFLVDVNGGEQLQQDYPLGIHAVGYEYGTQNAIVNELIDDALTVDAFLVSVKGQVAAAVAKRCMSNTGDAVEKVLARFVKRLKLAAGEDKELIESSTGSATAEAYFELDASFRAWLGSLEPDTNYAEAEEWWNRQASDMLQAMARQLAEDVGPDAVVGRKAKLGKEEEWMSVGRAEQQFAYWLSKTLPYGSGQAERREGDE